MLNPISKTSCQIFPGFDSNSNYPLNAYENKSIVAGTVGDLYYQALKYLYDNNYLSKIEDQIPFATSSKRFLIAKEPIHQRGNPFRCPIEYKGYFMETHKNYEQALKQLEVLVNECGLSIKY